MSEIYSFKSGGKTEKWRPRSGFCVAIAGKGFCVVAADQPIRDQIDDSIIYDILADKCVLASSLKPADWRELKVWINLKKTVYEEFGKELSSHLMCIVMYKELFVKDFYREASFNVLVASMMKDDVPSLSEAQAVDLVEKVSRYAIGKDFYAMEKRKGGSHGEQTCAFCFSR
ncbi:proteasome subunit beta type-1-like isoform X2 [Tripterygium wilfordii]|uniref:proteasome subunit beta type-1-like isoform X2 n=1 Tax=Tripterygium wilfordii TaxID=458696 RepID=UPI0018F80CBD|nr:proteasome subunit beta type-1-like isoform X2 [Tripterygium wilfordii]